MFGRTVSLFKVFGFEIRIDLSWLILAALITWSLASGLFPEYYKGLSVEAYWWMGAAGALGLFLSIVTHELSHSLVARHYGLSIKGITLFIFGGVAQMEGEPSDPKSEFLMAAVGPLASFFMGLLFFLLYGLGEQGGWPVTINGVINYLSWVNIILAVFNLIPAFPLDGGRILRSILWRWKKDMRWSTEISSQIGSGFGLLMIIMGVIYIVRGNFVHGLWWFLIGLFIRSTAQISYKQLIAHSIFTAKKVKDLMVKNPVAVPRSISLAEFINDYVYKYHFKAYPVLSFGKLSGCIFVKQIAEIPREEWTRSTVGAVALPCSEEITIGPEEDANKALEIMNRTGNSRLLVVNGEELEGIISLKDMLALLSLKMELNDLKKE